MLSPKQTSGDYQKQGNPTDHQTRLQAFRHKIKLQIMAAWTQLHRPVVMIRPQYRLPGVSVEST